MPPSCPRCKQLMKWDERPYEKRPDQTDMFGNHRWFQGWHCIHCGHWESKNYRGHHEAKGTQGKRRSTGKALRKAAERKENR